ncbi:unnamed protein product [Adineta steineri]|uniref:NHL repeat containing protein-like protein n=1 Tax=Adineta steineri TaxID=433720 RepID=A0A816D1Z7_9BILA|nr:unnamed protein product [Adineta steineri]CAF1629057.1 unnamed protein product [Adineta steineri]
MWPAGSAIPTRNITGSLNGPFSVFVTANGDVYVDNGYKGRVRKWTLNATTSVTVMYVSDVCYGLFVDMNNTIYCSQAHTNVVVASSLDGNANSSKIVAGNGSSGSTSNMLYFPMGIFVDINFNLYVADSDNNRIQFFKYGQMDGTTVVGEEASVSFALRNPTSIVLDANSDLFIVDSYNTRIVRSSSTGFRCVIGCTNAGGSNSDQLPYPWALAFDSYGNIFVSDYSKNQLLKFIFTTNSCEPSFNQPELCPTASWNLNAITFADNSTVGLFPRSIFIDINNTVYVVDRTHGFVQVWLDGNIIPTRNISGNFTSLNNLFVTINGDIYVDNNYPNGRIDKWSYNDTTSVTVMYVSARCDGLFVDMNNTIYCSQSETHIIVASSPDGNANSSTIVAGTGSSGSTSDMLDSPTGIFVDINFNLYVADSENDRIQFFKYGQMDGMTVAGVEAPVSFALSNPTSIVLDADNYLFIVDSNNNRIVRSDPTGFRCLVGCTDAGGSDSDQLRYPWALAFDSYGNIFVTDEYNNRIQKFIFQTNSCVHESWHIPSGII